MTIMQAANSSTKSRILALPSLGGILAIANCLSFVGVVLLIQSRYFGPHAGENYLGWVMAFLTFPLALPLLLPSMGSPTAKETIAACVAVGINSFIWGYAMAWFCSKLFRRRRSSNMAVDQPTTKT